MPPNILPTETPGIPLIIAFIPTDNSGKVVDMPKIIPKAKRRILRTKAKYFMFFTAKSAAKPRITKRAIREAMLKILKKAKIEILTEATVTGIDDKKVIYKTVSGEEKTVNADRVLLSVGMKSNNESFRHLNLKMEKNFVFVNDQSAVPGKFTFP